jgi:lysozyme
MGKSGQNDRGIYDDAIFVLSPTVFAAFNANTDPSADPSAKHVGLATLEPGVWRFKPGMHGISRGHPYPALVQDGVFVVRRDGTEGYAAGAQHSVWGESLGGGRWRGSFFAINNHKGSRTSTSSEGCQTIWPDQWDAYLALVKGEMIRHVQPSVPYVLVTVDALS